MTVPEIVAELDRYERVHAGESRCSRCGQFSCWPGCPGFPAKKAEKK